jgi:hypothetical protein
MGTVLNTQIVIRFRFDRVNCESEPGLLTQINDYEKNFYSTASNTTRVHRRYASLQPVAKLSVKTDG